MMAVQAGRVTELVTAGLVGVNAMMRKAQNLGVHARAGGLGGSNHMETSALLNSGAPRSSTHLHCISNTQQQSSRRN